MEFAKSLSGHDKNHYYYVVKKEDGFLFLVNGTTRPLEKPKKKNEKHVQIVKRLPMEVTEILEKEQTNLTIKRAIKEYETVIESKQEGN